MTTKEDNTPEGLPAFHKFMQGVLEEAGICCVCGEDIEHPEPDPAYPRYCSKKCWLQDGGPY